MVHNIASLCSAAAIEQSKIKRSARIGARSFNYERDSLRLLFELHIRDVRRHEGLEEVDQGELQRSVERVAASPLKPRPLVTDLALARDSPVFPASEESV